MPLTLGSKEDVERRFNALKGRYDHEAKFHADVRKKHFEDWANGQRLYSEAEMLKITKGDDIVAITFFREVTTYLREMDVRKLVPALVIGANGVGEVANITLAILRS